MGDMENEQLQIHRPQVEIQVNKQEEEFQNLQREKRENRYQLTEQTEHASDYEMQKVSGVQREGVVFDKMQAHPLSKEENSSFQRLLAEHQMGEADLMKEMKGAVSDVLKLTSEKTKTGEEMQEHIKGAKEKYVEIIALGKEMLAEQSRAHRWGNRSRSQTLVSQVVEKAGL